jgi:hypothetical protein
MREFYDIPTYQNWKKFILVVYYYSLESNLYSPSSV